MQIGIRTDYNRELDRFSVLDAPWVHRHGIEQTVERIKQCVGTIQPT